MDSETYLKHLRADLDAMAAVTDTADLDAPVEHCGDWTLYDLINHMGGGNLWSATAVTERRGDGRPGPAPRDRAELAAWFRESCEVLIAALNAPADTEAWTFAPDRTVGFWQRRRCQETVVHRWDIEHAVGRDHEIDPAVAEDGVSEVFEVMAPLMVRRGRLDEPEQAIRLSATDTDASWTYGPGEPVAEVRASAQALLLMLWKRCSAEDQAFEWEGDRDAGLALLAGSLTP